MNYWVIFLTGITTGGLACLAMQGGLLASVIANQKEQDEISGKKGEKKASGISLKDFMPVLLFLLVKLIVHTIFGFFLGWLGSKLTIGLNVRLAFQLAAAMFMFATAMNLLNVSPIFRFLAFQPPRFLQRYIRRSSKSGTFFAPMLLGALTIFIPCGVTQAMEVVAISSGSPIVGALVLFFFVLGTSPLFTIVGVATARLSGVVHGVFLKTAAILLIGLSLYSVNGILVVLDSPVTFSKAVSALRPSAPKTADDTVLVEDGVQQVTISVMSNGYSPKRFTVKKNIPVELTLESDGVYSCAAAFTFRAFNISAFLDPTDSQKFTFTPTEAGSYTFSCSMGMYGGVMTVE